MRVVKINGGQPSGVDCRCNAVNVRLEIGVDAGGVEVGKVELDAVGLDTYGVRYVIGVIPLRVGNQR